MFITFEGPDKAGKSTQIDLFCEYLESNQIEFLQTREPGGCPVCESIREVILDPRNDMGFVCEAMLYAASRSEHVRQVIKPALNQSIIVVCDRFLDSSMAYQGYGRGLGYEYIEQLNAAATQGLKPDLTFYLDIHPEVAIKRMDAAQKDRLEAADEKFRKRVNDGYDKIIARDKARFAIIDAQADVQTVHGQIVAAYQKAMKQL